MENETMEQQIEDRIDHSWHDKKLYAQNENTLEYIDITDIVIDELARQKEEMIDFLSKNWDEIEDKAIVMSYDSGLGATEFRSFIGEAIESLK